MRLDVVLERDGPVARIDELATPCVGLGLGEPGLGVLECVERAVLDAGDALDAVAGAFAVHGRAFALTGLRAGALLVPSVFYVAGQEKLLGVVEGTAVYGSWVSGASEAEGAFQAKSVQRVEGRAGA